MMNQTNRQTFLGFDFGTKRIGMAVGQMITKQARPIGTVTYVNGEPNWQMIQAAMSEWQPAGFVIGIPYNMDGSEQNTTLLARTFAQTCGTRFHLPVYDIDERLTTVEAKAQLFEEGGYKAIKNSEIDAFAAKLILEAWLNQT